MSPARLAALLPALLALACTDDAQAGDDEGPPSCVEVDYEGCAELYPPTWDQVWTQTLSTSCDGGGSACHASEEIVSSEQGLAFVDPDVAYARLISGAHVVPGDAACSPLVVRLEIDDPGLRMPPGETPIAEGARCSIAHWILDGAAQN